MRAIQLAVIGLVILPVVGVGLDADLGRPDEALTRLFTPRAVPAGMYVVYRSARPLEAIVTDLRALDPVPAPGAWQPTRPEAHGAFGQEGIYDRARLARLFNGKRVTLVRGSIRRDGREVAYTLISPYPDPTISAILDGTMVIEFRVPRL